MNSIKSNDLKNIGKPILDKTLNICKSAQIISNFIKYTHPFYLLFIKKYFNTYSYYAKYITKAYYRILLNKPDKGNLKNY